MQTPKNTASKSTASNQAAIDPAEQKGKKFNEDDDFDDDFEDDTLDDLDYDGVTRFDDDDDDF